MGPSFTAGIVQQLGVTPTAALVDRFGSPLTGALVQAFGPELTGAIVRALGPDLTGGCALWLQLHIPVVEEVLDMYDLYSSNRSARGLTQLLYNLLTRWHPSQ